MRLTKYRPAFRWRNTGWDQRKGCNLFIGEFRSNWLRSHCLDAIPHSLQNLSSRRMPFDSSRGGIGEGRAVHMLWWTREVLQICVYHVARERTYLAHQQSGYSLHARLVWTTWTHSESIAQGSAAPSMHPGVWNKFHDATLTAYIKSECQWLGPKNIAP